MAWSGRTGTRSYHTIGGRGDRPDGIASSRSRPVLAQTRDGRTDLFGRGLESIGGDDEGRSRPLSSSLT
jgi:hypothetical protein